MPAKVGGLAARGGRCNLSCLGGGETAPTAEPSDAGGGQAGSRAVPGGAGLRRRGGRRGRAAAASAGPAGEGRRLARLRPGMGCEPPGAEPGRWGEEPAVPGSVQVVGSRTHERLRVPALKSWQGETASFFARLSAAAPGIQ